MKKPSCDGFFVFLYYVVSTLTLTIGLNIALNPLHHFTDFSVMRSSENVTNAPPLALLLSTNCPL